MNGMQQEFAQLRTWVLAFAGVVLALVAALWLGGAVAALLGLVATVLMWLAAGGIFADDKKGDRR